MRGKNWQACGKKAGREEILLKSLDSMRRLWLCNLGASLPLSDNPMSIILLYHFASNDFINNNDKDNCYEYTAVKRQTYNYYTSFFQIVQVQLSPFSCHTFPCPTHPHLPTSILPPFGFVHGSFIHVSWQPFPFFSPLSPLTSPLVTVSLFFISISLVTFCCLVCFVD